MKEIKCSELEVGKIYSSVYIGPNISYGEINGKNTFEVTSLNPVKMHILFSEFGNDSSDRLISNEITCNDGAFKEEKIYETPNQKDWFIKSEWTTLDKGISEGILTLDDINGVALKSQPYKCITSVKNFNSSFCVSFDVEGRSKDNLYLQRLYIRWGTLAELRSDFEKYGVSIN